MKRKSVFILKGNFRDLQIFMFMRLSIRTAVWEWIWNC